MPSIHSFLTSRPNLVSNDMRIAGHTTSHATSHADLVIVVLSHAHLILDKAIESAMPMLPWYTSHFGQCSEQFTKKIICVWKTLTASSTYCNPFLDTCMISPTVVDRFAWLNRRPRIDFTFVLCFIS